MASNTTQGDPNGVLLGFRGEVVSRTDVNPATFHQCDGDGVGGQSGTVWHEVVSATSGPLAYDPRLGPVSPNALDQDWSQTLPQGTEVDHPVNTSWFQTGNGLLLGRSSHVGPANTNQWSWRSFAVPPEDEFEVIVPVHLGLGQRLQGAAGLLLAQGDGATDDFVVVQALGILSGATQIEFDHYLDYQTFGAAIGVPVGATGGPPIGGAAWLCLQADSDAQTFEAWFSTGGAAWNSIGNSGALGFSPTRIGLGTNAFNGGVTGIWERMTITRVGAAGIIGTIPLPIGGGVRLTRA